MKKAYAVLFGLFMLVACGEDNSASATDSLNANDFGEGYTIAIPFKYDEATGIAYQGTYSCNYHPDSKTFTWEENTESLDPGSFRIVGDSLWMGPVQKQSSDNDDEQTFLDAYYNVETLALSKNHDGIYGVWNVTGCERKLGESNIKCTKYIGNMSGIARTLTITKDTVYNTTIVDANNLVINEINLEAILNKELGFNIGNQYQLDNEQIIKKISCTRFQKIFFDWQSNV